MQTKLTSFLALLAAMFVNVSAFAQGGGNFIVINPVLVTDLSTLSPDDYYVLKNVGSSRYNYYDENSSQMDSKERYDYSSLVRLYYNSNDGTVQIQQVCNEQYYQGLTANQRLSLGQNAVNYEFNTNGTESGQFRFANGNCFLNRYAGGTQYPIGAAKSGTANYSRWNIYKVDIVVSCTINSFEQIKDLSDLSGDNGYYVLENVNSAGYYTYYTGLSDKPINVSNDSQNIYNIVRLFYNGNKIQIQQVCTNAYYQALTNASTPVTLGESAADFNIITEDASNGYFRFNYGNLNIHYNSNNADPVVAATGTGPLSQWKIYKVKLTLNLTENDDITKFLAEHAGITFDTTLLNRKVVNGYNTAVFPFDLNEDQITAIFGEGATVYTYSGTSESENQVIVSFNSTDTENGITANTPVLVKVEEEYPENTFKLSNVTFAKTENEPCSEDKNEIIDFVGVYTPQTIAAGNYFVNGELYKSSGNTTIKPFRAYLKVKEDMNQTNVKLMIGGTVTGIDSIDAAAKTEGEAVYNLLGQRVSKAQKGIYIVNGKKVVVK